MIQCWPVRLPGNSQHPKLQSQSHGTEDTNPHGHIYNRPGTHCHWTCWQDPQTNRKTGSYDAAQLTGQTAKVKGSTFEVSQQPTHGGTPLTMDQSGTILQPYPNPTNGIRHFINPHSPTHHTPTAGRHTCKTFDDMNTPKGAAPAPGVANVGILVTKQAIHTFA
jgi:hypothetical protein